MRRVTRPPAVHPRVPRRAAGVARRGLVVVLLVALSACAQVDEATQDLPVSRSEAQERVGDAVLGRLDQAREAFGAEVVDVERVCALVEDDRLSDGERDRLELAVEVAESLGLPADVTVAARTVLDASDGATDRVGDLLAACRDAGVELPS